MPRIVIAYCNLEFQAITEETPKPSYVFNLGKINKLELKKVFLRIRFQRTRLQPRWSWCVLTTWCHVNTTPRRTACWPGVATMVRSATGMTGQCGTHSLHHLTAITPTGPAASLWGRSLSPPPTGSQFSRQCGFQARLGRSSSQPHQTERSC